MQKNTGFLKSGIYKAFIVDRKGHLAKGFRISKSGHYKDFTADCKGQLAREFRISKNGHYKRFFNKKRATYKKFRKILNLAITIVF